MAQAHDRTSAMLAGSSRTGRRQGELRAGVGTPLLCTQSGTDPLSDVLRAVRLTGAVFHRVEASFPWGVEIPDSTLYRPIILPQAQHMISYHIILEGDGFVCMPGSEPVRFEAGDILLLAGGTRYALLSTPGQKPEYDEPATTAFFREWMNGTLPFVTREGGGGEGGTAYICGFLGCDTRPFNPVLCALPPLTRIKWARIKWAGHEGAGLLGQLIELTLAESGLPGPGGEAIRLRLCELIFVEVMRLCLQSLPAHEKGWLSGLRDPSVGTVLALLHAQPAKHWTLDTLAAEAGMSRAALAARFAHLVGHGPMHYLALWRMQLAANRLSDSSLKVAAIGRDVGYASEAAFSRAFKKATGLSPSAWRNR